MEALAKFVFFVRINFGLGAKLNDSSAIESQNL
jgi:hypothetical protein